MSHDILWTIFFSLKKVCIRLSLKTGHLKIFKIFFKKLIPWMKFNFSRKNYETTGIHIFFFFFFGEVGREVIYLFSLFCKRVWPFLYSFLYFLCFVHHYTLIWCLEHIYFNKYSYSSCHSQLLFYEFYNL